VVVAAVGPCFTGGFEEFVVNDENGEQYTILYLPDRNNDALQQENKAPVFYWIPGHVRLARFGDTGDYKFRHIHFVGVLDEDMHVGVEGRSEVVGGLLSLTTTSRYPTSVLQQAEQQLLDKFRGSDERYWGWRTRVAPMFRIAPIRSNRTVVTNLSPGANGSAPVENVPTTTNGATGSGSPPGRNRSMVRRADLSQRVIHGRAGNISNLDAWAFQLQGQGPASTTGGENAFSGLMGALPSELIWAGFQGGASPIVVAQHLEIPVWSQEIYLKITGNWERIFQHFSGHANAEYLWFGADIKAEFNQLRINGDIQVEMAIDGTLPGADQMEEAINARIDLVLDRFMEQATQRIFEPAPPEVEPAEAPSGGFLSRLFGVGSGGFALKYRRDETRLNLHYEETRYHRYLQPTVISSSFEGFYREFQRDPDAEKKYFIRLVLGHLSRKVTRILKPVCNWPDPSKDWVGEPVAFMSAEVGYPGPTGSKQWTARVFQSTDTTEETSWEPAFVRREEDEVANPPSDWDPDITYIRRRVHLTEPIGMSDNHFVKVDVEQNVVDLDPEGGLPSTDTVIEVRADSVGKLEVGPIDIDVVLQDNTQVISVEFKPEGRKHDGSERSVVKFQWEYGDQDEPRYWEIFTGQLDYVPRYQYRVSVFVKGTLFSAGMAWTGSWVDGQGNGPMMVHVPRPDEEGVRTRRIAPRDIALRASAEPTTEADEAEASTPPPISGNGHTAEPITPPPGVRMERRNGQLAEHSVAGYDLSKPRMEAPPSDTREAAVAETGSRSSTHSTASPRSERLEELSSNDAWVRL